MTCSGPQWLNPLSNRYFKDVDLSYAITDSLSNLFLDYWGHLVREHVFLRFGKQLKRVRVKRGFSQEKLAEEAGLHRTYVSTVERGMRNISILNIEKLADALEIPLSKLMPE